MFHNLYTSILQALNQWFPQNEDPLLMACHHVSPSVSQLWQNYPISVAFQNVAVPSWFHTTHDPLKTHPDFHQVHYCYTALEIKKYLVPDVPWIYMVCLWHCVVWFNGINWSSLAGLVLFDDWLVIAWFECWHVQLVHWGWCGVLVVCRIC